jgi:hypothetical protein
MLQGAAKGVTSKETQPEGRKMSINKQSEIAANIQIGPTDQGMVRIYIEADGGIEIPLDFDPEEADEIAEELRAAAEAARMLASGGPKKGKR